MTLPGTLFAKLWQRLAPMAGAILAGPWAGRGADEFDTLLELFQNASQPDVPAEIDAYLKGKKIPFSASIADLDQRALAVMCALDEAVMTIHPGFPRRLSGFGAAARPMLSAMRARRVAEGNYAEVKRVGLVIPKGNLRPRTHSGDDENASGTELGNQFEYLALVAPLPDGRTIRIIAPPPSRLLVPIDRSDQVGLAPIAEDREDLKFEVSNRGDRPYLDTLPRAAPLGARMVEAVTHLLDDGAGLVVLPELVAPVAAAEDLSVALRGRSAKGHQALILAGTGPSKDHDPVVAKPYNEAVLMGADGRIFARQRKLHLFNMSINRMRDCGIAPMKGFASRNHLEYAAAGSEIVICDFHGLGRVLVLICEDLEQPNPSEQLARSLRPDWILTPVLDISQEVGRWTHTRAIDLSRRSGARVVVSCSATLGVRMAGGDQLANLGSNIVNSGLCVDMKADRRFKLVRATGALSPDRVTVTWDPAAWDKHELVTKK